MSAATALATGHEASPQLVEEAILKAMARAKLERPNGVLLFLTRDFGKKLPATLRQAAATSGCLQVGGMTAHGVFTEEGLELERPAAAALVLGGSLTLEPVSRRDETALSFGDEAGLPGEWLHALPRLGLLHSSGGQAWSQARLSTENRCDMAIRGASLQFTVCPGLMAMTPPLAVNAVRGLDLLRIDGHSAIDSLRSALPPQWLDHARLPLHLLAAIPEGDLGQPASPLLSANANESVTLAVPTAPGKTLAWGLRNPMAAAAESRTRLADLRFAQTPSFGLMFSCIGRGPMFYGGNDLDIAAWRERFPKTPLIGAYGTGQLTPFNQQASRLWHNSMVTAVFRENVIDQDPYVFPQS